MCSSYRCYSVVNAIGQMGVFTELAALYSKYRPEKRE